MTVIETGAPNVRPIVVERNAIITGEREDTVRDERPAPWDRFDSGVYRCEVRLEAQEEGGYTAYLPSLPGVISEGSTRREAIANIKEATVGAIRVYSEAGDAIPWDPAECPLPPGEIAKWIVVHV